MSTTFRPLSPYALSMYRESEKYKGLAGVHHVGYAVTVTVNFGVGTERARCPAGFGLGMFSLLDLGT